LSDCDCAAADLRLVEPCDPALVRSAAALVAAAAARRELGGRAHPADEQLAAADARVADGDDRAVWLTIVAPIAKVKPFATTDGSGLSSHVLRPKLMPNFISFSILDSRHGYLGTQI